MSERETGDAGTEGATDRPPAEVSHLVRERTEARARRDWDRADALKAEIERAGWRVVDHGGRTSVRPAAPRDVEVAGERRYGAARSVPSRLDEPATAPFTVVLLATDAPERFGRLLEAVLATAPAGSQVVVVANDPSPAEESALVEAAAAAPPGVETETLRTSARVGYAAALDIGLRRAAGSVVVLADGGALPRGDAWTPLADALGDPGVAVAGGLGLATSDRGRLDPHDLEPTDARDVAALRGAWLAFRRDDYRDLGPLDERFVVPAWLDVWWSLRLRAGAAGPDEADEAAEAEAGEPDRGSEPVQLETAQPAAEAEAIPKSFGPPPRRAVRLDLPLEIGASGWPPERTRLARRNMYRVLRTFGWRSDLLEGSEAPEG